MMIKNIFILYLFSIFIALTTGCGPQHYSYRNKIQVPDANISFRLQEQIPTRLNVLPPIYSANIIGYKVSKKNKGPVYLLEIDTDEIKDEFQKALTSSFKQSNFYHSISITESSDYSHRINTKLSINDTVLDRSSLGMTIASEIEVEYSIVSNNGKIITSGSIHEKGNSENIPLIMSQPTQLRLIISAVQEALSKAAARIPQELAKNSQFMQMARADANQSHIYAYSSPQPYKSTWKNASSMQPSLSGKPLPSGDVGFGNYYALIIGNNQYRNMPVLQTASNDASTVAALLEKDYGFTVTIISDASRYDILAAMDDLRSKLTHQDNLLIYYAGHGFYDQKTNRGYWLPVDAHTDTRANWISNIDLTDTLKALDANHVMIVADSCYSGTLTRGVNVTLRNPGYFQQIAARRSRTVLTSGGVEPVADSGGGRHSVFAKAFIDALEQNTGTMDGTELFTKIRRPVILNADQTPEYSDIRKAGHEGGDFLFIRKQ
jgi:uncharacterized caspase-like protein